MFRTATQVADILEVKLQDGLVEPIDPADIPQLVQRQELVYIAPFNNGMMIHKSTWAFCAFGFGLCGTGNHIRSIRLRRGVASIVQYMLEV